MCIKKKTNLMKKHTPQPCMTRKESNRAASGGKSLTEIDTTTQC